MTSKINKKLDKIQAQIDELRAENKQDERPWYEGVYWYISDYGSVDWDNWANLIEDKYRLATNNMFRTEEDAETFKKITLRAHELMGDWVPDWEDDTQIINYLSLYEGEVGLCSLRSSRAQGTTYMPRHAAETLLEEFTQDELKIWVGVR